MSPAVSLWFFLSLSLFISLMLAIFPLPPLLADIRPQFMCLLVIYWVVAVPQRLGIVFAFSIGLLQSVIESSIWGGYSLALSLTVYLCIKSIPRLRNYSLLHQSLWVFVWILLYQLISGWVLSLAGYESSLVSQLVSSALSAVCWPFLFLSLNWIRQSYRVH